MDSQPSSQPIASSSPIQPTAASPVTSPPSPPAPAIAAAKEKMTKRFGGIALMSVLALIALVLIARWGINRATSSITDDAFIEAHIINVAPQSVSGHLVRYLVEENDRVESGQLLAEIDPVPYRD